MTRNDLWAVLTVGILFLAGCGGWSAPAPVAETPGQAKPVAVQLQPTAGDDAPTRELPPSSATPETVVAAFLHAARSGDEATATHLLTDKARRETEKEGLALDPPGTPTMKFQIGNVEIPADNRAAAYVGSSWSETEIGDPNTFEVTWILRRQSDGWRIAGMATQMTPQEQPVLLNFEDAEHIQRIKQEIGGEPLNPVADDPLTARESNGLDATRR